MAEDDEIPTKEELDAGRPSALAADLQMRVFKQWCRDDAAHSAIWRQQAKEDFDFLAGHQWTPDEKSDLKDQLRPEIVFNRSITLIKAVAGFEINSRHEIQFLPRNTEDTAINEVLTGASKWMGDECDAEDEESEAFQDSVTCGMGWTENRMDYEEDPAGKYIDAQVNPLEMYWDFAARKKNLSDARRRWRLRKIPRADAREMFPDVPDEDIDARWAVGMDPEEETRTLEQKRIRDENAPDNFTERDEVHIVQLQWWEREPFYLVADPSTNKRFDLDEETFLTLQARAKLLGLPLKAVKMKRRRFKQAFLGNAVLDCSEAPCPTEFSFQCITGEPDKNKGTWFGLIRVMRDPQKWANKWLSQTLHIMNSNAKGGIMAEPDAFEDQRQAEETYAKPESITWMKKGALSSASGAKWVKKPAAEFPAGFFQLLEFSISSLRDVTGINLELLGQRDVSQPGILEAQRKQAGMTVLATMFDSLRRFRKQVGRLRLYFIQNYLNDGRLIRIVGPDGAKVLPLLKDKTLGEYDVHVDETPTSPNQKQANWAVIAPLIPMFKDQLIAKPQLFATILDYSPLPSRMVDVIKAVLMAPDPDAERNKQLMVDKLIAAISKDQSTAEMQNAKAGATQATATYDLAMAHNLMTKNDQGNPLKDLLDAGKTAAQIDTERATADNIRARTHGEHASAAHTRVKALVDAMTPIAPPPQPPTTAPVAA